MENQTQPQTQGKSFIQSTTIIFNAVIIAVVILKVLISSHQVTDPDVLSILTATLNILNRFRTTTPINLG